MMQNTRASGSTAGRSSFGGALAALLAALALTSGGRFGEAAAASDNCSPHWDNTIGVPGLNSAVWTLALFSDGADGLPTLFAGGHFTSAGGVPASRVAQWNAATSEWAALGGGMDANVRVLAVLDDGSGPALYAGGEFTVAGDVVANGVAKWNHRLHEWSALGSGVDGLEHAAVLDLTLFDDGAKRAIYVAGNFTLAGNVPAKNIAEWDVETETWSALGEGMNGTVRAVAVFDDGDGPALYAGGNFTSAGGAAANHVAKWDFTTRQWSAVGGGTDARIDVLKVVKDGPAPGLYAGGTFNVAGGVASPGVARWDGAQWSALPGLEKSVLALEVFDVGSGPVLFAGGTFMLAIDNVPVIGIAQWDWQSWTSIGLAYGIHALAAVDADDGGEAVLYIGGIFEHAGSLPSNYAASWRAPQPAAPGDLDCDGSVGVADLLMLLAAWGPCADCAPGNCPADLTGDCAVGVGDLLILLANWG